MKFNGEFLLEINTFSSDQTIQTFAVQQRVINGVTQFGGFQRDAAGNLVVTSETITLHNGFSVEMYGDLRLLDTLAITGHVFFSISSSGLILTVNGSMTLSPIGQVTVTVDLNVGPNGLLAYVGVSLDVDFGDDIGLSFSATVNLGLNTTGVAQTVSTSGGPVTVDPGFLLHIDGSVTFLGFASASGFVDISIGSSGFLLQFAIHFSLGGLEFDASGGAAV